MADHRKGFEDAIRANPYDQPTRLIFADWLEENGFDDEALIQRAWTEEKQRATDFIHAFAAENKTTYEKLMEAAKDAEDTDSLHCDGLTEDSDWIWLEGNEEFWNAWEVLTTEERPPPPYDGCSGCYD